MSKFAIDVKWLETSTNSHHSPHITSVIDDVLMLGNRLISGRVGEQLSSQKVAGQVLPSDLTYFAAWTNDHPAVMRVEWAFMEDDVFMVVQKYFAASTAYKRNGVYHSPPEDVYRICGDDWSLCFNARRARHGHEFSEYMSFYGVGCCAAICDLLTAGDFDAFESDTVIFKLMGYFESPPELS
jgi:hypothetical protein